MTTGYDAFISYASPDLRFAEEVYGRLTAAGFAVWFDKERLQPGFDWHREIEQACEASRVLLPVLTPHWKLSEWTRFETYGAEAVIPLIVDGAPDEIFTPPLTRFQGHAVDFERLAMSATEDNHPRPDSDTWEKFFTALRSLLDRPAPDRLARLTNVRYRANPYFVGREKELTQIHEQLHQRPTAVLTQGHVQALAALGGVGKTTLARQYVEKFWRCYPQIFWVDCRLGIETELARVCDTLLPEHRALTSIPDKARMALRKLESRDDRLLVLDNAENERSIQDWIPKTGSCRTLITSRFAGWSAAVEVVPLDVLEPDAAHELLTMRAGRVSLSTLADSEQSACEQLARELGYLPLALEQAAAYIEQQGASFGFADYLKLYRVATEDLLAAGVLGSTEYPDSVITTWKTTTAKLPPAARGILRLCAFLAPTPLPISAMLEGIDVLREEAAAVSGDSVPAIASAEFWIRQQVGQLRAYSMADTDGHSLRFHTLVQTVERLQLDEASGDRRATLCRSLEWMDRVFVGEIHDKRTWPKLERLLPHAHSAVLYGVQGNIHEQIVRLMSMVELSLHTTARYSESESLARRQLVVLEKIFPCEHPQVALVLSNLALTLQAMNRSTEAEAHYRRALAIDERYFGPRDVHVARDLSNLADVLRVTGKLPEASQMMSRVVSIFKDAYGEDHPNFAVALANQGKLLQEMNRLPEAETLLRRALKIIEHTHGADQPTAATILTNLAVLLKDTHRLTEAERCFRRALAIDERFYGAEHPNVARVLSGLAGVLQATNRPSDAEPLMRRSIEILFNSATTIGNPPRGV